MVKVDIYTKAILTIIAVCLVVLAFRPIFNTPAEATGQVIDVNIASIGGSAYPYETYGQLPVSIEEWNAGTLSVE